MFFNFQKALELAKQGVAVSHRSFIFNEAIGYVDNKEIDTQHIWNPVSKMIVDKYRCPATVALHLTHTKECVVTMNWNPTLAMMCFNDWMLQSTCLMLNRFYWDAEQLNTECTLQEKNLNGPFWMVYDQDMLGHKAHNVFIGGSRSANIVNAVIIDELEHRIDDRANNKINSHVIVDEDFLTDGWLGCLKSNNMPQFINVDETDTQDSIGRELHTKLRGISKPVNVYIDIDSLHEMSGDVNDHHYLDIARSAVMKLQELLPNICWICISLNEQVTSE